MNWPYTSFPSIPSEVCSSSEDDMMVGPYLSPVSATPLRLDCHEPVTGLGISFGDTESPFTHSSFVESSQVASSLPVVGWYPMGPSEPSNETIFDLGSSMPGMDYGAYPNYADISTSPLGLYSTQPMIASSSYGGTQGATSGHPSGFWPITTSSEAISTFSSSEMKELDEYGEQPLFGDAMYAAEVPLLPQGPQISTENFSPLSLRGPGSLLGLNPNEAQNPSRISGTTVQSLPSPPISKTDPVDTPSPRRRLSSESSRKCDLCDITFTRTSNCREHMKKKHDPTCEKTHSCGICSRAFRRRPDLTRHVDCVHRKLKKFTCDCGRHFSRQDILSRHKADGCQRKPRKTKAEKQPPSAQGVQSTKGRNSQSRCHRSP